MIKLISVALVVFAGLFSCLAEERKPNVIVIITDDQGYGDMSCHGNPYLKTPEMDRLHDESVRLTDFHVDPTCAPTRAALMTGRYSARTGVWLTYGSRHHLRRDEVTMADVFQRNGYRTAIFGKWHLGDNYPFRPTDRGFDESLIHGGGVIAESPDYWDNNYYDDTYFRNNKPEKVKGYCTDVWCNETIKFVERNTERPFFAYLSFNAPHGPLHVPESYRKPYADQSPSRAAFYGMIACIDENIGKLMKKLNELSLDRDTIVVFLNDNGTNGGAGIDGDGRNGWVKDGFNAGMRGRKTSRYEGGHRAACFIRWPKGGLNGGRDVNGVTAQIDLLPTFIDLCGLQFDNRDRFDGISLAEALRTGKAPERTVVVHDQGRFGNPVGDGLLIKEKDYSVMHGSWRLVGKELFNLEEDLGQRNDVAAQHPEMAERLRGEYEAWWKHIAEKSDEYNPFVINPSKQQTVLISSQNLLGGNVAYSQRSVRKGQGGEFGWTFIDAEVPGTYLISLRRWPRESNLSICAEAPPYPMDPSTHKMMKIPCKAFDVVSARLQVGAFDQSKPVEASDQEIVFEVNLPKEAQRIQTWFTMKDGGEIAAYYTYIENAVFNN
ncbi:arylsulfatase [Pontiella sulfatireligans]|uniref:Arylsulfatase n=1 Tax=Pontiella sulfatireligans TaxID=2750658 RepID=A0A6C2UHJ0_9BACT|nr:arylsulfatase [Pontiella sulfatireligans]SPS74375.1 sulfatase S1_17 [Kiritimatiellales bacterium]VGO19660.1 Arylsulfatase [Pontiella sulfatireligans]